MYQTDKQLVKQILKGNERAFESFFNLYYTRMFRFCQRRVSDTDAEDIAMQTIQQAIRRIETYRGDASLLTWLYHVARSQLSAHFRREAKHQPVVLFEDNESLRQEVEAQANDDVDSPESAHIVKQNHNLIHSLLDQLPANYGDLLEWKYIEGLSINEIAARLGSNSVAVQSSLARARRAFRRSYDKVQLHLGDVVSTTNKTGNTGAT